MSTTTQDDLLRGSYGRLGMDISKVVVAALGFFYTAGYLVQAITLRNYGIYRLETVKLQYVEVGLTFTVLLLLATVMPVACFLAHFRIRKRSGLLHYRLGAAGYTLNTYNLLFLVVCFALFFTQEEWASVLIRSHNGVGGIRLAPAFIVYICISVFVLLALPLVERLVQGRSRGRRAMFWLVVEPVRFSAVAAAVAMDVFLLRAFPWLQDLLVKGLTFAFSAIVLASVAYVIVFYVRKLGDKDSFHALLTIGLTGLFVLLYICINAYVYSVVRHIPMNRGGKLPVTQSYLGSSSAELAGLPIARSQVGAGTAIGPVYVLEETEDYLYVAEAGAGEWYKSWAVTYAVRKDTIGFIRNERIEVGGPRAVRDSVPSG